MGRLIYFIDHIWKRAINNYLKKKFNQRIQLLGNQINFNGKFHISGAEKIVAGNNIHIGNNAFIAAEGGLNIGDNVHISRNLVLYTHNHNYEGKTLPYDDAFRYKKVIIEKNVWIGINVTILPGAHIEEGAIIGAGAVITGKINKCQIVGAPIATLLKSRDLTHYDRLENENKYGGSSGILYKK